ncbi:MAG: PHP domain-containing protein [Victivallaceae bacterium]
MKKIDLHMHSTASDGTFPPAEIVAAAAAAELAAVALTDHDTTDGIDEFMAAGRAHPEMLTIPGIEISTLFDGREVHIVGLFIDHHNPGLIGFIKRIQGERHDRNLKLVEKLEGAGYPVTMDEVTAVSGGKIIGRPHFAQVIREKYAFNTLQDVFENCLKRGTPGYYPRVLPQPAEAIKAIHAAGGIAVWAHPVYRNQNERSWVRRVLRKIAPEGLDAVEAYYSKFDANQTRIMTELAKEFNLALSGGSDFHGENSPGVMPGTGFGGLDVPENLLQPLLEIAKKYILKQSDTSNKDLKEE